ncbi:uncharacterized protein MELLADRAFT_69727 [Melampsora larici-populina 98AG31]|uniref:Uncharacterized protein n=1 Tax=Melampsora larici-populina (strain 98AG31 / pathotype 3-4-7) TaxID=747676 RepID=F4SBY1_MELLP|nr:uncharacterized protein MELLADRAFT_69727 [Melampsora larici-populina 98AG31]EGF97851.1 hypothetical protein MELLADRAFT_69727 [Melampsora larici-populina 98AG31]
MSSQSIANTSHPAQDNTPSRPIRNRKWADYPGMTPNPTNSRRRLSVEPSPLQTSKRKRKELSYKPEVDSNWSIVSIHPKATKVKKTPKVSSQSTSKRRKEATHSTDDVSVFLLLLNLKLEPLLTVVPILQHLSKKVTKSTLQADSDDEVIIVPKKRKVEDPGTDVAKLRCYYGKPIHQKGNVR